MKKLLFILFALIMGQNLKAQSCTCNPNGFNPFEITLRGAVTTVRCGHQFSLNCGETIKINGGYKCTPAGATTCPVKFVAVLKNAAGVVIQNYSPFTFPWSYAFAAAGNYSLEITPICGTNKCPPCRFFFTVTCPQPVCNCNPNGWVPFNASISNNPSMSVNCGHQFGLTCRDTIRIKGNYRCLGTCVAKYSAVLKNAVTGAIIQNYPVFNFTWQHIFPVAGNYKLEITPICGNTRCTPCVFYFTVTCPTSGCDCSVNGWQPFTSTVSNNPPMTVNCGHQFGVPKGKPFKLVGKYLCKVNCLAKYTAVLKNNVTGALVMNYPVFTFPWTYTFAIAGNYKLEIIPICGDKKCEPCVFYFTVN